MSFILEVSACCCRGPNGGLDRGVSVFWTGGSSGLTSCRCSQYKDRRRRERPEIPPELKHELMSETINILQKIKAVV